jgi:hypothetical protein
MINMSDDAEVTGVFHGCKGKKKSDWRMANGDFI